MIEFLDETVLESSIETIRVSAQSNGLQIRNDEQYMYITLRHTLQLRDFLNATFPEKKYPK